MNKKKNKLLMFLPFLAFVMFSCGENNVDPLPPTPTEYSVTNPHKYEEVSENSESVELTGPFSVYNEDGSVPSDLEYKGKKLSTNSFDNMYEAIRIAGENSTTKNKKQVQDSKFNQIFIRSKASQWYVFDEHNYVGTATKTKAISFTEKHPKSYAVSGDGSGYAYLGRDDYSENNDLQENVLELNAGAYNYMFSKNGVSEGKNGFAYCTADVRLSEMTYKASEDGDGWNAYIFINLAAQNHCDLGLIGNVIGGKLCLRMFRNCGYTQHTDGASFYVYGDKIVTTSTKYDEKTKEYSGCDDLHFEALGVTNGWILNITNLRTNEVFTFEDLHYDKDGNKVVQNGENQLVYYRALIASSYCPVVGNIWNWDCKAATNNVVWENIEMSRYISDNIEDYRKDDVERFELYPDSKYLRDGYSQGAFASSFEYGTRKEDGTYKSGATYKKGSKYLIQSVDYNS